MKKYWRDTTNRPYPGPAFSPIHDEFPDDTQTKEKRMNAEQQSAKAQGMEYVGPQAIMLDLETLGTEPGCGIIEIGYCLFPYSTLQRREAIHATGIHHTITLYDNLINHHKYSAKTLHWWEYEQQGLPIYSHKSLQNALAQTADHWNQLWKQGIKDVWCKPSSFDIPILATMMDNTGIDRPEPLKKDNFRHWNCFATLRRAIDMFATDFKEHKEFQKKVEHNAKADAVDQAVQANIIFSVLPEWRRGFNEAVLLRNDNNTIRYGHKLVSADRDKALKALERLKRGNRKSR